MADIFISYKRSDRDRVEPLVLALESLGLSVWFDARLEAGAGFDAEINREVEAAGAVIVAWTKDSVQSEWVRAEASIARERGVLAPAFLERCRPFPPFNLIHGEELFGWRGDVGDRGFRRLLSRIGPLVGRPGLAEWVGMNRQDRDALAGWVRAYPDDPLAPDARAMLERLEEPEPRAEKPSAGRMSTGRRRASGGEGRAAPARQSAARPVVAPLSGLTSSGAAWLALAAVVLGALNFEMQAYEIGLSEEFFGGFTLNALGALSVVLATWAARRAGIAVFRALLFASPFLISFFYIADDLSFGLGLPLVVLMLGLTRWFADTSSESAIWGERRVSVTGFYAALIGGGVLASTVITLDLNDYWSVAWTGEASSVIAFLLVLGGVCSARLVALAAGVLAVLATVSPSLDFEQSSYLYVGLLGGPGGYVTAAFTAIAAGWLRRHLREEAPADFGRPLMLLGALSFVLYPMSPIATELMGVLTRAVEFAAAPAPAFAAPPGELVIVQGAFRPSFPVGGMVSLIALALLTGVVGASRGVRVATAVTIGSVLTSLIAGYVLFGTPPDLDVASWAIIPIGAYFIAYVAPRRA